MYSKISGKFRTSIHVALFSVCAVAACSGPDAQKHSVKGSSEAATTGRETKPEGREAGASEATASREETAKITNVDKSDMVQVAASQGGNQLNLVQSGPLGKTDLYLVEVNALKDKADMQMALHHYCTKKTDKFLQCALYDGNNAEANLVGVEYIVTKEAYDVLPQAEKALYHAHSFAILSGEMAFPGVNAERDLALAKGLLHSYGKAIITWNSRPFGAQGDAIPMGEGKLAESLTKDGQAKAGLIEKRDEKMKLDTAAAKERRQGLASQTAEEQHQEATAGNDEEHGQGVSGDNEEERGQEERAGNPEEQRQGASGGQHEQGQVAGGETPSQKPGAEQKKPEAEHKKPEAEHKKPETTASGTPSQKPAATSTEAPSQKPKPAPSAESKPKPEHKA